MSKPKKTPSNINLVNSHGQLVDSQLDVANMFCKHFASVADRLDADLLRTNIDPMSYMPNPTVESFNPPPATAHEVSCLITSLKDKPININCIPVFIFKRLSGVIAPIMCDIFNCSIDEGHFPSCLKLSI